jgi:hypothetical protein
MNDIGEVRLEFPPPPLPPHHPTSPPHPTRQASLRLSATPLQRPSSQALAISAPPAPVQELARLFRCFAQQGSNSPPFTTAGANAGSQSASPQLQGRVHQACTSLLRLASEEEGTHTTRESDNHKRKAEESPAAGARWAVVAARCGLGPRRRARRAARLHKELHRPRVACSRSGGAGALLLL